MRQVLIGLVFLTLASSLLVGGHLYVAQRLVIDPALPAPWRDLGLALIALLGATLIAGPVAERRLPRSVGRWLSLPAAAWMGIGFLLTVALGALDLLAFTTGSAARAAVTDPGAVGIPVEGARFRAALAVAGVAVAGLVGAREAWRGPRIVRREIPLARWPRALDGLRIVQISDLHIGAALGRAFATRVVQQVNALAPDLIAVTGDLADGRVEHLADEARPLGALRAPLGAWFVTGNHDHYSGATDWADFVAGLGIGVLRNRHRTLEHGAARFDLAGVDDHRGGFDARSTEDLGAALAGRDPARPVVLLAHDPATFPEAARRGVDLQLSGHTHGGQIWPFRWLVRLATPFVAGLYDRDGSRLYVSRGTGFWGPPLRLLAPAEITEITLRSA